MEIYPEKLNDVIDSLQNAGKIDSPTVSGVSASLECGTAITFDLVIDREAKKIEEVRFRTNGCGYMTAAGELIARSLGVRELTTIGGFDEAESSRFIVESTGPIPAERAHCIATVIDSVKKALSVYRAKVASEYNGDSPLVCSCYGVSENDVNAVIKKERITELTEFMKHSRAGTGCGSCRMVIEDLIAVHNDEIST